MSSPGGLTFVYRTRVLVAAAMCLTLFGLILYLARRFDGGKQSPSVGFQTTALQRPVVVDGRNIYDPQEMRRLGFV